MAGLGQGFSCWEPAWLNLTSLGSGARILSCLIRIGAIGRRWRRTRGRVLTCYWGFNVVELLVAVLVLGSRRSELFSSLKFSHASLTDLQFLSSRMCRVAKLTKSGISGD